jgi:hypothetical protein
MPGDRQFPVIFKMTKPVRRLQHRRSTADGRVCQPDTIGRLAIAYFLLEVRGGEEPGARRCGGVEMDRENLHRLGDVLEILPAEFAIGHIKLALDLIEHLARNADAAAISKAFEPSCDIDSVAEDVGALRDDVAEIYADAEFNALVRRYLRIAFEHATLNLDGTRDGVHDAAKFSEDTVPSRVGDVAAMDLDRRVPELAPVGPQPGERTDLVGAHQPAVSSHIGGKNGRKVSFNSRLFQAELHAPNEKLRHSSLP